MYALTSHLCGCSPIVSTLLWLGGVFQLNAHVPGKFCRENVDLVEFCVDLIPCQNDHSMMCSACHSYPRERRVSASVDYME